MIVVQSLLIEAEDCQERNVNRWLIYHTGCIIGVKSQASTQIEKQRGVES